MQPFFFIREDRRFVKINIHEIIYITACTNYVTVVTDKGRHMSLLSVKQLEKLLPPESFCRIHRSHIVALDRIVSFEKETVYLEKTALPMSAHFRSRFERSIHIVSSEVRKNAKLTPVSSKPLVHAIGESPVRLKQMFNYGPSS